MQGATGYMSLPGSTIVSAKKQAQSPGLGSTAQRGVFEWTQQSKPLSRIAREVAAPFRLLDGSVPYSKQQREKTVYTPESWQTPQGSIGQPDLIDRTKNSESLSDISKRPTAMPFGSPPGPIASWTNEQTRNTDFTAQDGLPYNAAQRATVVFSNTDKAIQQLTGKFKQTLHEGMAHVSEVRHSGTSQTLAAPVVASKSTSKTNDRMNGGDSKISSSQTAQSVRADIKHRDKQLAKDTGLLKAPAPLPATAVSSQKEPKKGGDLRGQGSHTGKVIEGQTGTQSINAGKGTTAIPTNEKKTIGHQILSSGIQFGKIIFGGLSNMLPFGGLFQYYPPVASTEQMPIEAYPDVYGTYSVQGEPSFGETFIPFGYPAV